MSLTGHDHSWQLFAKLEPDKVCSRGEVTYDQGSGTYTIRSFGQDIQISVDGRNVSGSSAVSEYLLGETGHFFDLALLWYLISAKDTSVSDELVRPSDLKGGQIFVTGTHVLPVEQIARKFAADPVGFVEQGKSFGGKVVDHGDASIRLLPFPKLPVTLILWLEDDEFPAKVDFFFHAGCDEHLPTDVLWSTAMVTVLAMAADL